MQTRAKFQPTDTPSFLIVCLRYLGDVLLSTPLALSIKSHLPGARVDYLVFKGTEGVLARNPQIDRVHTIDPATGGLAMLVKLCRRYDYSIGTGWSDRTAIFAWAAARRSHGYHAFRRKDWWKRWLLHECRPFDGCKHMVPQMLSTLGVLGIPAIRRVTVGSDGNDSHFIRRLVGGAPYVLLHPYTRKPHKYWPTTSWAKLAEMIRVQTGLRPILTCPNGEFDQEQFRRIQCHADGALEFLDRPFTFPQLAAAIRQSQAFVGVDTVATHVAAAVGAPTIALYGSTPASVWGPWPNDWPDDAPYPPISKIHRRGHITLLQQSWPCVPCNRETCFISRNRRMECLEHLSPELVFDALPPLVQNAGRGVLAPCS